jgi:hypothetical protein
MKSKLLFIATVFTLSLLTIGVNAQTNGSLEQRIQARESKIKDKLTVAQEARIKARCASAQIRVTAAEKVATKHHDAQDKKISAVISKLTSFAQKQKDSGADTTALETAIGDISKQNQSVDDAYQSYISALEDTAAVDCQADPSGFKVSLTDARQQFESLKSARKQLRQNLKDELVPALKSFKPKKGDL